MRKIVQHFHQINAIRKNNFSVRHRKFAFQKHGSAMVIPIVRILRTNKQHVDKLSVQQIISNVTMENVYSNHGYVMVMPIVRITAMKINDTLAKQLNMNVQVASGLVPT